MFGDDSLDTIKLKPLKNGSGSYGRCYIVDDNTLYKKFFINEDGKYPFHRDKLSNLIGIENDTIIFPTELDIVDDYVRGYYMKWIHAPNMREIDYDISLSSIISSLDKLELDLNLVSDLGIVISDVNFENVLFKDRFYLIDIDLCWKSRGYFNVNSFNERMFTNFLHHYFIKEYNYYEFIFALENYPRLENVYCASINSKSISSFKEFLIMYKEYISEIAGCDIDNFKNVDKVLLRDK